MNLSCLKLLTKESDSLILTSPVSRKGECKSSGVVIQILLKTMNVILLCVFSLNLRLFSLSCKVWGGPLVSCKIDSNGESTMKCNRTLLVGKVQVKILSFLLIPLSNQWSHNEQLRYFGTIFQHFTLWKWFFVKSFSADFFSELPTFPFEWEIFKHLIKLSCERRRWELKCDCHSEITSNKATDVCIRAAEYNEMQNPHSC